MPGNFCNNKKSMNERRFAAMGSLLSKKQHYCFGDFNIDLMQISTNNSIRRYADMLLSCTCLSLIELPTQISLTSKTLLDHIYTNNRKR